tara:strand:+ start:436 stop:891 length:456 start_codon:yes stop_codon:yes gene_type:complete
LPGLFFKGLFPSEKDLLKGFIKSNYLSISDSSLNTYNNNWNSFPDTRVDQRVLPIIKKLIKEFQTKGIKILIYESPMYNRYFAYLKKRNMQLDSICQLLNNPFVNLNLEPSIIRNPNYFENTKEKSQHLTSEEGEAVSKVLANKIIQLKLL